MCLFRDGELYMITTQNLKRLLPSWYDNLLETNVLMAVEQELLNELASQIQKVQDNQYIATADSETLTIYEAILRIGRQPTDTLEMRRLRILSRLSTQKPYTKRYLQEVLESFGGTVQITNIYNEYRLIIESTFEKQGQMGDADYLIRTVIPANLITEVQNHLALNNLKEQIFLGEAMTCGEMVIITSDYQESVDSSQKISVGVGSSQLGLNALTSDFKESGVINGKTFLSVASTHLNAQKVTADFSQNKTIDQTVRTSSNLVSAEFITLEKERD